MSERSYRRELMQWSYLALIFIVVAFTTMDRVVAGNSPSAHRQVSGAMSNESQH
jgi:hypothetical protein